PVMRAPLRICLGAYSSRMAIRAGISLSAIFSSLRPQAARDRSAMAQGTPLCSVIRWTADMDRAPQQTEAAVRRRAGKKKRDTTHPAGHMRVSAVAEVV